MSLGAVSGGLIAYFIAQNNLPKGANARGWQVAGLTAIGAVVGSTVGYGIGGWLNNLPYASHAGILTYMKAYLYGLFGSSYDDVTPIFGDNHMNETENPEVPHIWDWHINLGDVIPPPPPGRQTLIFFFNAGETTLDVKANQKQHLDRKIRQVQRSLRRQPDDVFVISGGTTTTKDGKTEDYPIDKARERARVARDYMLQRIKPEYRDRVQTDDGKVNQDGTGKPKARGDMYQ
jgi:hypothetical protein